MIINKLLRQIFPELEKLVSNVSFMLWNLLFNCGELIRETFGHQKKHYPSEGKSTQFLFMETICNLNCVLQIVPN